MLASLKGGLETIGGMAVLLFFLSQHLEFSLHWHALSELVNSWTVKDENISWYIIILHA